MKCRKVGPSILIVRIIIQCQPLCYGRSAFPHSNFSSHYSTGNSTIQGESHEERTRNVEKVLRSLGAIRADHYARKAVFFEKELEICLTEVDRCHSTIADLRDHLASTVSTARTSDPHVQTTPNIHGSSRSEKLDQENCTKAESGNPEESRDKNVNLANPKTQLEEKMKLLRRKDAELSEKTKEFLHPSNMANYDFDLEILLTSVKFGVIARLEKFYESHLPKGILYEDTAEMMNALFSEEEIVYVDFLLTVMENSSLVQRSGKTTARLNLPPSITEELEKLITTRMVRWMLFVLFGHHPSLPTLRSTVESEPNLSLFEFCWCISKIWDTSMDLSDLVHDESCSWIQDKIRERVETSSDKHGNVAQRSIRILLMKCELLEEITPS